MVIGYCAILLPIGPKPQLQEVGKVKEGEDDFKKAVIGQSPGAKGMIQQIDVVLRKKIKDTVEIERVFSRTNSLEIMRKCIETYVQESPPYYTQKYHLWKREKVMLLYSSLSRGPCAAEYGLRLEKECNLIWTQGRQGCEHVSLTGKECRLKLGHGTRAVEEDDNNIKHVREDRAMAGRHSRPSSTYRNSVGLEKYEGIASNTNYMLPWTLATKAEVAARDQRRLPVDQKSKTIDKNEWPLPGKSVEVVSTSTRPSLPPISSLEAFPALGTTPIGEVPKTVEEPKKEKRRRDTRRRDKEHRLEGLIRGYVGAEYECPLGHRFLSCADGRVCKLGHKGHPKEHGNYFVHQDLPLFVLCLCNFASHPEKPKADVTAQLQRLYMVTPADVSVTIAVKPIVKFKRENQETVELKIFDETLVLPPNGVYVLRLPYIYRHDGKPIIPEPDVEKRINNGFLQKDCFQVHFLEDHR
ncbi:Protein smg8 [Apophysomyces sp. BC1021]|nr:Protein smg8 [Apophysomyces sp. BC1021]